MLEEKILARCRKYNACVVYLISQSDLTDLTHLLQVEAGNNRRSGLSVGTALTMSLFPVPPLLMMKVLSRGLIHN